MRASRSRDLRRVVRRGYEQGDCAGVFRKDARLNETQRHFLNSLLDVLPVGATVLDMGCGTGIPFDKYLEEHGRKVTGIDFCHKHLRQARANVLNARFLCGDFSRIELSCKFNAVVSFYSVFHIPREEHHDLFLEMYRTLRPGGIILVNLGNSAGETEEDFCGARMVWSSLSPATYESMLMQTGFEVIMSGYEGKPGDAEYHFWVLARKAQAAVSACPSTDAVT